jgi:hypothetical protein
MRQTYQERARFEAVAKMFVVLVAGFLTFVSLVAFTCTGWGFASNSDFMLLVRHLGAMATPWAAVYFLSRDRILMAAGMMALAGPFFVWMEQGWGFVQPVSGFSLISAMPFAAAAVLALVHLVRLDANDSSQPGH